MLGTIKTLTIKRDRVCDWFVIMTTELADAKKKKLDESRTADIGLKNLVMLNTGEYVESPKFLMKSESKLRRVQRQLSRKKERFAK